MLVYQRMIEGFELVKITDQIQEAEQVFSPSPDKRQVFYFDDFLGSTHSEILFPRNRDSSIVAFIERIRETPNKLLILTSRTNVYNQASYSSERFQRVPFSKYECEIQLDSYNTEEKARILYNHLYFSDLPSEYKDEICAEKNYWKIIRHRNYNPRIIELITNPLILESVLPSQYLGLILAKLSSPVDVWKGAYENQLTHEARRLLVCLYSLEINWGGVPEIPLRQVFQKRMRYELERNGISTNHNAFDSAIAVLLRGMVSSTTNITEDGEYREYRLHDPSIIDFLNTYIAKSFDEKAGLLHSILYLDQFERFWSLEKSESKSFKRDIGLIPMSEYEKRSLQAAILERLNEYEFLEKYGHSRNRDLFIAFLLSHLCPIDEVIDEIQRWYDQIDRQEIQEDQLEMFLQFLLTLPGTKMRSRIMEDWNSILLAFFSKSTDWNFLQRFLSSFFKAYDFDYETYMGSSENKAYVQGIVDTFWERNIDSLINYQQRFVQHVFSDYDFDHVFGELKDEVENLCLAFKVEPSRAFDKISEIDKEQTLNEAIDYSNQYDAWGADTLEQDRIDMFRDSMQDGLRGIDDLFG